LQLTGQRRAGGAEIYGSRYCPHGGTPAGRRIIAEKSSALLSGWSYPGSCTSGTSEPGGFCRRTAHGSRTWTSMDQLRLTLRPGKAFHSATEDLEPERRFVVHPGEETLPVGNAHLAVSLQRLAMTLAAARPSSRDSTVIHQGEGALCSITSRYNSGREAVNRYCGAGRCNPGITWIVGFGLHTLRGIGRSIKRLGKYWQRGAG
jgi:hypothetical protein